MVEQCTVLMVVDPNRPDAFSTLLYAQEAA